MMLRLMVAMALMVINTVHCSDQLLDVYEDFQSRPKFSVDIIHAQPVTEAYLARNQDGLVRDASGNVTQRIVTLKSSGVAGLQEDVGQRKLKHISCYVPVASPQPARLTLTQQEQVDKEQLEQFDPKHAAFEALQVITKNLGKQCMHSFQGWWTFEYCHNLHLRQYHAEQPAPDAPPEVILEYLLARFPKKLEYGKHVHVVESAVGKNGGKRGLQLKLQDGTKCDLTGRARRADITMYCNAGRQARVIKQVREVSTCHYTVTIMLPDLCDVRGFEGGALDGEDGANVQEIKCHPVVSEEEYALHLKGGTTKAKDDKDVLKVDLGKKKSPRVVEIVDDMATASQDQQQDLLRQLFAQMLPPPANGDGEQQQEAGKPIKVVYKHVKGMNEADTVTSVEQVLRELMMQQQSSEESGASDEDNGEEEVSDEHNEL